MKRLRGAARALRPGTGHDGQEALSPRQDDKAGNALKRRWYVFLLEVLFVSVVAYFWM